MTKSSIPRSRRVIPDRVWALFGYRAAGIFTEMKVQVRQFEQPADQDVLFMRERVRAYVERWYEGQDASIVRDAPILHLVGFASKHDSLMLDVVTGMFSYIDFACLSQENERRRAYNVYRSNVPDTGGVKELPYEVFEHWCRPQMPASTTMLVSRNNAMLLTHRGDGVLLHPGHLHAFGATYTAADNPAGSKPDWVAQAMRVVCTEGGFLKNPIHSMVCLGICGNSPQDQPIIMFVVWSDKTTGVLRRWFNASTKRKGEPHIMDVWTDARQHVAADLAEYPCTPSLRALAYLASNYFSGLSVRQIVFNGLYRYPEKRIVD